MIDGKGMLPEEDMKGEIPARSERIIGPCVLALLEFLEVWQRSNHRARGPRNRAHLAGKALAMILAWPGRYGFCGGQSGKPCCIAILGLRREYLDSGHLAIFTA